MSTRSNYRKLTKIIEALTKLKEEISPEKNDKNADPYETHKKKITDAMTNLREEVDTLNTISNDRDVIEQKTLLRKKFETTQTLVSQFGDVLKKVAKTKVKPEEAKVRDKKVKQGHQWMELTQEELLSLAQSCRDIDMSQFGGGRHDTRDKRIEEKQNARKQRRKNRRNGGGDDDDYGEGIHMEDMTGTGMSDKEQAFMVEVEQARIEEEEMLEMISNALSELHELALTLNKLLKQTANLIDEVDEKMDKVQARFDTTNQKLEKMLADTGGLSRWCPICICILVLLALAGYIVTKVM